MSWGPASFRVVSFNPISFNGLSLAPADQGGGWFARAPERAPIQRAGLLVRIKPLSPMEVCLLAYGYNLSD